MRKSKTEQLLAPIRPNVGIELAYRRKIVALIDEMQKSTLYWLGAAYKANSPEIAQDESPAAALKASIKKLRARWLKNFDKASQELADYFATEVSKRSDATLKSILKRSGLAVEFKMSRAQNDIVQATVAQNVALIKSIPQQYLTNVEGAVMRSVQTGRDLGQLTKDLQEQFGVSKRRAAFIARDQNNKATAALTRARQIELGITQAIWTHSGGGKEPRPTHVKAGREQTRYDTREGWYDTAVKKKIFPGELPGCRCVARAVVRGLS